MPLQKRQFGKSSRLNKPAQYKQVFQSPCRSVDKYLVVVAAENRQRKARLGLAISGKKLKRAACRNRLKRLIRESFRHHQDLLQGLDVVVTAGRNLKEFNNYPVRRSLEKHWQQVSKCRKSSSA